MEMKMFENICENCSEIFFTIDEEAILCQKCWESLMSDFFEEIKFDFLN